MLLNLQKPFRIHHMLYLMFVLRQSISGTYFIIDVLELGTGFRCWVAAGKDITK